MRCLKISERFAPSLMQRQMERRAVLVLSLDILLIGISQVAATIRNGAIWNWLCRGRTGTAPEPGSNPDPLPPSPPLPLKEGTTAAAPSESWACNQDAIWAYAQAMRMIRWRNRRLIPV